MSYFSDLGPDGWRTVMQVEIYTDGACSGNPGPGGWGAILLCGAHVKEISGNKNPTTSNEMEFTAVLMGLSALKQPSQVTVFTDSSLVIGALTKSWKIKTPHLAKLRDEIRAVAQEKKLVVLYVKVAAHTGDPLNERADALAKGAIEREDS